MAVQTTSQVAPLTSFVHRAALRVAQPKLVHEKYGMPITIPTANSTSVKLRRYERFAPTLGSQTAAIRTIVEGVVPSDTAINVTNYTITTAQYGLTTRISDVAIVANEVVPTAPLQQRNSENMAQTTDMVYRDGILSGTQVFYCTDSFGGVSGSARTDVVGRVNAEALDKAIRNLEAADAPYWTDSIDASTKIGTMGVLPSYVAMVHPHLRTDLRKIPGWQEIREYATQGSLLPGEIGSYRNIRFVMSTLAKIAADSGASVTSTGNKSTSATLCDVYPVLICGREAYAVVKLADMARIIWIPPTSADHFNPLGQWGTLGWKAQCASGIINDNWILRAEFAVSA